MKTLIYAAALTIGTAAIAQTPPGTGITNQGTNPEGQACTPAGFNQGANAYPPCSTMNPMPKNIEDYPPCTRQNADRCRQTYTRWTRERR